MLAGPAAWSLMFVDCRLMLAAWSFGPDQANADSQPSPVLC